MSITFPGPCTYCAATNYLLSLAGPSVCPRCDTALSILRQRPAGIADDQYRALVLEVAHVAGMFPKVPGELWPAWRERVILALQVRCSGRPFPAELHRPLSEGALAAIKEGNSLARVLMIAAQRPQLAVIEVRKPRADQDPAKRRWSR